MFNKYLEQLQSKILADYGNTAYILLSKDNMLKNIPNDLYELWYSPYKFSFRHFKDVKDLPFLKGRELISYYFKIVIIFIKVKIIFKKIKGGHLLWQNQHGLKN